MVATIPIPGEHCDECKKGPEHGVILIQMQPGPDGKPWALCSKDHYEGRRHNQLNNIPAQYKTVEAEEPRKRRAG